MGKLTYSKVFSKYNNSFSDYLADKSYMLYKGMRFRLKRVIPIKDCENIVNDTYPYSKESSNVPQGYNYIKKSPEEGYVKLEYIDFYDFLPKENVDKFKKEIIAFISKNKLSQFRFVNENEFIDGLNNMEQFFDYEAFDNLCVVNVENNKKLARYATQLSISIRNLSFSFLAVHFRFYINDEFNKVLKEIYSTTYSPYTKVLRQINVPWYKPYRFGRSFFTGDNKREEVMYNTISRLKWDMYYELRKHVSIYFDREELFPPVFSTYSTNIRPGDFKSENGFWKSILFESCADYSIRYNACVCFNKTEAKEGTNLCAYCGEKYNDHEIEPELAQHDLANIYGTYMVASCLNKIAIRDVALCNKRISKAIKRSNLSKILKLRVKVNNKLYYSKRFISEFTGKSIDKSEINNFKHRYLRNSSISDKWLTNISNSTLETKKHIDLLMSLLNDSAEYGNVRSNNKIQWIMLLVTSFSLLIAIISLIISNERMISILEQIL